METTWNGSEFDMIFRNRTITLTTEETQEFEQWVMKRINGGN